MHIKSLIMGILGLLFILTSMYALTSLWASFVIAHSIPVVVMFIGGGVISIACTVSIILMITYLSMIEKEKK